MADLRKYVIGAFFAALAAYSCAAQSVSTYSPLTPSQVTTRTITAAGPVTATTADYIICINKTVGAATTVNLPPSPSAGLTFIVKDCKGDANTNNITVIPASGLIDGASSYTISINFQSSTVFYNGSSWSLI